MSECVCNRWTSATPNVASKWTLKDIMPLLVSGVGVPSTGMTVCWIAISLPERVDITI